MKFAGKTKEVDGEEEEADSDGKLEGGKGGGLEDFLHPSTPPFLHPTTPPLLHIS
jgi:hypothetical protein